MCVCAEYFISGQTSDKTDVFAYGVFLLELVSGRDVYDLTLEGMPLDLMLRDWVSTGRQTASHKLLRRGWK